MPLFKFEAIDSLWVNNLRLSLIDDGNNNVLHRVADEPSDYPCRHCLKYAKIGEKLLLASYHIPKPQGVYWSASPVFIHLDKCERYNNDDQIPQILIDSPIMSVRVYDANDLCLYDLGILTSGDKLHNDLTHIFKDPRVCFVNIHTTKPGCMLTRVVRAD